MSSSLLFSPLTVRGLTFTNRLWVAPMCQYSATDGLPNDWHLVHLGTFAKGGAGLVLTEATAVTPQGRISPGDTGLWNQEHSEAFARITRFITEQGSIPGIQLAHAGRKASTHVPWHGRGRLPVDEGGWETLAPSVLSEHGDDAVREMSRTDIDDFVGDFTGAAKRALDAGFRVLEVHAAHGYLLHQFLSPLTNRRTDEYGGICSDAAGCSSRPSPPPAVCGPITFPSSYGSRLPTGPRVDGQSTTVCPWLRFSNVLAPIWLTCLAEA